MSEDEPQSEEQEELQQALADLELPEPGDEPRWHELAQRFLPIYLQAASGEHQITGAQRQILDRIMDRGFGKVGSEQEHADEIGVVVLPTLYDEEEPVQVCPRCESELESSEEE